MRNAIVAKLVVAATLTTSAWPAPAADICEAVATRDLPAIEAPDSILRRGEHDTAITQYRVSKKTGRASFCSHGGYCYPADGLKMLNCKVGAKDRFNDPDETYYNVDVIRSKVRPHSFATTISTTSCSISGCAAPARRTPPAPI